MTSFVGSRKQPVNMRRLLSEEPGNRHIRFDYSDTYIDNEDLDLELEDQEYKLKREQFKKTQETEKNFKKAKQSADSMLWLKNALKNRDPNESSNRVVKSAELKRRSSSKQISVDDIQVSGSVNKDDKGKGDDVLADNSANNENDSKPKSQIGNLTMFLLSLQKLKGCGLRQKSIKQEKQEDVRAEKEQKLSSPKLPGHSPSLKRQSRPSSLKHSPKRTNNNDGQENASVKKRASSEYGIHVKKDFTRSRRELEEISRLEQNAKYGCVNKYEERRKRLLDSCKDTEHLKQRISDFLKNVDEFKKDTMDINTEEKVLYRAKSAHMSRSHALWRYS